MYEAGCRARVCYPVVESRPAADRLRRFATNPRTRVGTVHG